MWTLASAIERAQEQAEARLPTNAKPKTRERLRERILRQYLGLDQETVGGFREPGR